MDRYAKENAIFKIDGYFSPAAHETPDKFPTEFERARAELLGNLRQEIVNIELISYKKYQENSRLCRQLINNRSNLS